MPNQYLYLDRIRYRLMVIRHFLTRITTNFRQTSGETRAGSLAFTFLLSFVPFSIAIASILSWIPISNSYVIKVEKYFFTTYLPHNGMDAYQQLRVFINQSKHLSSLGFGSLIITSYMMLFAIEKQLNALWYARRQRTIWRSLMIHTSFIIGGPLLIVVVSLLRICSHVFLHSKLLNFFADKNLTILVTVLLFTLAYKTIPSHKIRFKHALIAGISATIIFEVFKKLFFLYSFSLLGNYHIIYGSLAFMPIFLIWIYVSCLNLLFCAEIVRGLETCYPIKVANLRLKINSKPRKKEHRQQQRSTSSTSS